MHNKYFCEAQVPTNYQVQLSFFFTQVSFCIETFNFYAKFFPDYTAALSSVNVKRHFDFGNTRVIGEK